MSGFRCQFYKGSLIKVHNPKLYNMAHLYLNVFTASKGSNNYILLNPKFQAPSLLLLLYRPVCVGPGEKPKLLVFLNEGAFIENNFKPKKSQ